SFRLFLWGMVLVPFAVISDAILDAVLFSDGSIQEQLFSPTTQEVAIRLLFSTFILAAIYLGIHYLAKTSQKEAALLSRVQDLSLVRQDLEEFHENLSRQLRQTSASLTSTVELLQAQCSNDFDEKTQFFMENVYNCSSKLNEQLDINQALTELTCGEPHREKTRLDFLAKEVVEELQQKYPDRDLEFKIQPWLSDWCDQKMLRLIIHNLFCNAIDFIPAERKGRIELGMFNRNEQKVFFVRDNGTGYSEAQAKRMFDAFRDNSLDAELPKDAITLANARRVISRHNGQIWAEGIEGAGGTVFFTCNTPT
ncbi:MAG TPA: HAMP domain-containing sensor histidine kinase, partial [Desulfuromonadales bacterium]|nr:HAMP domain-containing sensor histidine kinase [Desulfuromonadales bacterium]